MGRRPGRRVSLATAVSAFALLAGLSAGVALAHTVSEQPRVTIAENQPPLPHGIHGRVSSPNGAPHPQKSCSANRRIHVQKGTPNGNPQTLGYTRTNQNGWFELDLPGVHGRIFVRVVPRHYVAGGHDHHCLQRISGGVNI